MQQGSDKVTSTVPEAASDIQKPKATFEEHVKNWIAEGQSKSTTGEEHTKGIEGGRT